MALSKCRPFVSSCICNTSSLLAFIEDPFILIRLSTNGLSKERHFSGLDLKLL